MIDWVVWGPSDLTVKTLHDILALRADVFIVEQESPYQDIDGLDITEGTVHLAAFDKSKLVAYSRLYEKATNDGRTARIGRVVVHKDYRGGLGSELLDRSVRVCKEKWPEHDMALSAQTHLQGFYAKKGFMANGDIYMDCGVPHIEMIAKVQ